MKLRNALMLAMAASLVPCTGGAGTDAPSPPSPQSPAPDVWLIPGGIRPDRQPDGNTVVFAAPAGLVVIDTGRHRWHRDAIESLARAQDKPIAAIVNTHWHLDHVSGNATLRAAYPGLRVYATDAIDEALTGFLARSAKDSVGYLADTRIPEAMREDIRADLATIENGAALRPDVVIERSQTAAIAGRSLQVHRVANAVTAADLWLYDAPTRTAVLGDLVTLPAPFLDTACPDGWRVALQDIASTSFERAVPGHGAPMGRAQFELYRASFDAFLRCANSAAVPAPTCASQWTESIAPLLEDGASEQSRALHMAEYYVGVLRENGGKSQHCGSTQR